jgi:hypothetical protein
MPSIGSFFSIGVVTFVALSRFILSAFLITTSISIAEITQVVTIANTKALYPAGRYFSSNATQKTETNSGMKPRIRGTIFVADLVI